MKCRRGHHGVQTRGARAAYHGIEDERHARLRALSRSVGTADRCAVTGRCRLLVNCAVVAARAGQVSAPQHKSVPLLIKSADDQSGLRQSPRERPPVGLNRHWTDFKFALLDVWRYWAMLTVLDDALYQHLSCWPCWWQLKGCGPTAAPLRPRPETEGTGRGPATSDLVLPLGSPSAPLVTGRFLPRNVRVIHPYSDCQSQLDPSFCLGEGRPICAWRPKPLRRSPALITMLIGSAPRAAHRLATALASASESTIDSGFGGC